MFGEGKEHWRSPHERGMNENICSYCEADRTLAFNKIQGKDLELTWSGIRSAGRKSVGRASAERLGIQFARKASEKWRLCPRARKTESPLRRGSQLIGRGSAICCDEWKKQKFNISNYFVGEIIKYYTFKNKKYTFYQGRSQDLFISGGGG